ncbi:MAG: hypothetical protein GQ574_04800 [Crocinitomix sp.]|nr:hypothetical protein [Crocinitomix sp.]
MKWILFLTFFVSITASGQYIRADEIHDFPEVAPEFPGGDTAFFQFIDDNFQFSPIMDWGENQIEIYVSFNVMKDGHIESIECLLNHGDESVFREVKRVLRLMPNWKPGEIAGKMVNVRLTIPFKKEIYSPYRNYAGRDKLVFENEKLDTSHIYKNPQIRAVENDYLSLYSTLISENFKYPEVFFSDTSSHYYSVRGIINEKGRFNPLKVGSSKHSPLLDSLAIEATKKLPDFYPARINGQLVKSYYSFGFHVYPPQLKPDFSTLVRKSYDPYLLGYPAFRRYFESEFNYSLFPSSASTPIYVYLTFEVNEDGRTRNVEVVSDISLKLKTEIIRVFKTMAGWKLEDKTPSRLTKNRIIYLIIDPTDSIPKFTPTHYPNDE